MLCFIVQAVCAGHLAVGLAGFSQRFRLRPHARRAITGAVMLLRFAVLVSTAIPLPVVIPVDRSDN